MKSLREEVEAKVAMALEKAGVGKAPPMVTPATKAEFGDYQVNGAMAAAKIAKRPPREIAIAVAAALKGDDLIARTEVAGPGFINLHLNDSAVLTRISSGLAQSSAPSSALRVVVDYSAPNLAKEMHVGHLRSTIIGDAIARVLTHLGHEVIRQNHIGDWGTQFGMLITHLNELGGDANANAELADLEKFYVASKLRFDADPIFAQQARQAVVDLQSGDPKTRASWQRFLNLSFEHCQAIYQRLGVLLTPADARGESAYNEALAGVIHRLEEKGLLTVDDGAKCVFLPEFKGKNDEPLPVIVQKRDGGFLYATTDLAAVIYRSQELHAQRVIYVVGNEQSLHFKQIFAVARAANFAASDMLMEHCAFGQVLGNDGRKLSTREGKAVKLKDLLDEAEGRATELITSKSTDLAAAERQVIARAVGIGAIKYADLSKHRSSDYTLDFDQMISLDGNTAPYLQYAHARIRSLFRRAGLNGPPIAVIQLATPQERVLALHLARFSESLDAVARELLPHYLCNYLFELSGHFSRFYESCPILDADPELRASRLLLAWQTGEVLKTGLALLGIEAPERL